MQNFGKELRGRYIVDEPLLPESFDQNLLYMRATSLGTARTLVSGESLNSALYPDGAVPVRSLPGFFPFVSHQGGGAAIFTLSYKRRPYMYVPRRKKTVFYTLFPKCSVCGAPTTFVFAGSR